MLAEAEAIIAEATGEAEPTPVPAIHRANQARRPTGGQKTYLPGRPPARQSDLFS
jgi:ATP-dependent helicase Lhr and Lhr-like helicase